MSLSDAFQKSIPLIPARRRLLIGLVLQGALAAVSLYFALLLRLDLDQSRIELQAYWTWVPALIALRIVALLWFNAHTGLWRYVSVPDLLGVAKATTAATLVFTVAAALLTDFEGIPRSVFLIEWGTYIFLAGGLRIAVRVTRERLKESKGEEVPKRRVVVVGAGDAGASFCSQVQSTPDFRIDIVGVIDDDLNKIGSSVIGVQVFGPVEELPSVVDRQNADLIVIAIPSASQEQRARIIDLCRDAKVEFRLLPATNELLAGNVSISKLRKVEVTDLLGRPETHLDSELLQFEFTGKIVAVTGAAGSIGSELARRVLEFSPEKLILIDRAENPLVLLDYELRASQKLSGSEVNILTRIADITDSDSIKGVMDPHGVQIILHAAAHKHVYLMEDSPADAVINNLGGVINVSTVANDLGVEKVVLVSTDKAVNPTSIMGASKRMSELAMQSLASDSKTQYCAVRFGNVLGSNASVVPIFQQQIEQGGPVTVTHPNMERYFMTAHEAAGLILTAAAIGESGEIYLLDMGTPVNIDSLARTMIELSGSVPDQDIKIVYTGLKPGEKISEILSYADEDVSKTENEKIFRVRTNGGQTDSIEVFRDLVVSARAVGEEELREKIEEFVPEATL